jgi:LruC domain-containing protein
MKKAMLLIIGMAIFGVLGCSLPHSQVPNGSGAALPSDAIRDVFRPPTADFTFQTLLPVELVLDVELHDSTGGATRSLAGAVIIAALRDIQGNLVYEGRVADGCLSARVMLPSAPEDITLTLRSEGFAERVVKIPDMVCYSEVNRTMGLLSQDDGAKAVDPLQADSDGDLVPDVYDAFPLDPQSAFAYKIPADGNLTVAYEDLYGLAQAGDADYNDFIAEYSITEVTNGGNELHRIEVTAEETVKLAGYNHRFGIRIDGFEGSARLTGSYIDQYGNSVSMDRTETSYANIDLFKQSGVALHKQASFVLEFDTAQSSAVDRSPYNPYLYVLNTGQEIHLMGEQDLAGVPHSYQDGEGFPWGLLVPMHWVAPAETQRIEVHYPRFANWRQSFGAGHTDWYLHYDDPIQPDDIVAEEFQVTASEAEESNPRLGSDSTSELVVYTSQTLQADGSYIGDILFQRYDSVTGSWGSAVLISGSVTDDKFNDVSGSRIVYTAFDSPTSALGQLMLYDIAQGTTVLVMPGADTFREVRIDGDVVVWTQGQNGSTRILYRDLNWAAGVTVTLGGPTPAASNVEIGSRYIVWEKAVNGQKDIAAYDRLTGAWITVSADQALDERLPTTSGSWVAWQAEDASGSTAIRLANLASKPVTSFAAVDDGSNVSRPCVAGDLVAFESDAGGNLDIYLYRISDGRIFQVTEEESDQFLVNLYGDQAAYVDLRGTSLDIYASTFWLPPAE